MSDLRKKNTGEQGNGGEFAAHGRPESDVDLRSSGLPRHADAQWRLAEFGNAGETRIVNDLIEPPAVEEEGLRRVVISVGGDPAQNARGRAIIAAADIETRLATGRAEAARLAGLGKQMTVLVVNTGGTPTIFRGSGRITATLDGDAPIMTTKGGRAAWGYDLTQLRIVGAWPGYKADELAIAAWSELADSAPIVDRSTFEGIPTEWEDVEDPAIAAAYLIDAADFGDGPTPGCLFLATDIDGDSVNGYFWAPADGHAVAEHGAFTRDFLISRGGRIRDYVPNSMGFAAAMNGELGETRADAYRKLVVIGA